jgi:hypothetical protein
MSHNPAYDPRNAGRDEQDQQRIDEQYARNLRQQQAPVYNQPPAAAGVYSAPAPHSVTTRQVTTTPVQVNESARPLDRVRWGPILAGLVSALATLLVLSLLGVAVGLTAATGDPAGGANGAATRTGNYGLGATIWAAVSALIAFFVGGYVAGRTAGVRGKSNGWINGALVWAVTLPLLLWLAASGLSGFLNAIGFNLGGFVDTVNTASQNVANTGSATAAAPNADPAEVQRTAESARNGAWGALAALVLGLIAAGLGGLLGSRSHDDEYNINDGVVNNRY